MSAHYFLTAILPPLTLDGDLDIDIADLKELVDVNCDVNEVRQLRLFLTLADLHNLNALWSGRPSVVEGNLSRDELNFWQESPLEMPVFLEEFIRKWRSNEEKLKHFDALVLGFFGFAEGRAPPGFLKEWFHMEQAWQVALAAQRASSLGQTEEFSALDQLDPWQSELLNIVHAGPDLSGLQETLKEALDLYKNSVSRPLELFRQLVLLRFDRINTMVRTYSPFAFDVAIAYAARVQLVQRWQAANREKSA